MGELLRPVWYPPAVEPPTGPQGRVCAQPWPVSLLLGAATLGPRQEPLGPPLMANGVPWQLWVSQATCKDENGGARNIPAWQAGTVAEGCR